MKRSKGYWKILLLLPLFVGVYGFVALEGEPFLDSAFRLVLMYTLNYEDTPPNIMVEIARWTAPLATAGSVILAVKSLHRWVSLRWKYLRGGSVAVYGPDREKRIILAQLGRRGIDGGDSLIRARRYILLNDEAENFAFYQANADALNDCSVYIKCASLPAQSISAPNMKLFCPEEIAARLFWRQRNLYSVWKASSAAVRIVFLGFGKLGEELLSYGLQNNIFSPDQHLEYHIFGDCFDFLAAHPGLKEITDPVIPHDELWHESIELLEQAELVIVLEQQGQTALLQKLLGVMLRGEIDVFSADAPELELLAQKERLRLFRWQRCAMDLPLLLEDAMYTRAKLINLRYSHLYKGIDETAENMEAEWNRLDAFTRYSNVSAADYHEMRLMMLNVQGLSERAEELTAETMEQLAELEHIRWCRYHYLNNWSYGQPENGKTKDPARRIHTLLRPYNELPEAEKEKDRENIRVLLSVRL